MRVLDINNLYSPSGGGIKIYHHEKMKWCKANGIENMLLYPASENRSISLNGSIAMGLKSPALAGSGYHFFTRGKPIRKALESFNPDVVELGSGMVVPGMVHRSITEIPGFAFFHSNWPETLPMSVLGISKGVLTSLFQRLSNPLLRRAYEPLKSVIAASDYSISKLHKAGLTNLHKVPLGTNPDIFHPMKRSDELRRTLGVPENGKLILYMGRLAPEKGIHVLLKASKHLFKQSNIVIAIVGSGHWKRQVRKAARLNPGKIKLLQAVNSRNKAAELMASADVFVSAGPLETFSLVTLEALCSGTAVAACSAAAASELVAGAGGNSTYAPWDSGKALADAILTACEADQSAQDDFRHFAEKYTWDACFRKIFQIYTG